MYMYIGINGKDIEMQFYISLPTIMLWLLFEKLIFSFQLGESLAKNFSVAENKINRFSVGVRKDPKLEVNVFYRLLFKTTTHEIHKHLSLIHI